MTDNNTPEVKELLEELEKSREEVRDLVLNVIKEPLAQVVVPKGKYKDSIIDFNLLTDMDTEGIVDAIDITFTIGDNSYNGCTVDGHMLVYTNEQNNEIFIKDSDMGLDFQKILKELIEKDAMGEKEQKIIELDNIVNFNLLLKQLTLESPFVVTKFKGDYSDPNFTVDYAYTRPGLILFARNLITEAVEDGDIKETDIDMDLANGYFESYIDDEISRMIQEGSPIYRMAEKIEEENIVRYYIDCNQFLNEFEDICHVTIQKFLIPNSEDTKKVIKNKEEIIELFFKNQEIMKKPLKVLKIKNNEGYFEGGELRILDIEKDEIDDETFYNTMVEIVAEDGTFSGTYLDGEFFGIEDYEENEVSFDINEVIDINQEEFENTLDSIYKDFKEDIDKKDQAIMKNQIKMQDLAYESEKLDNSLVVVYRPLDPEDDTEAYIMNSRFIFNITDDLLNNELKESISKLSTEDIEKVKEEIADLESKIASKEHTIYVLKSGRKEYEEEGFSEDYVRFNFIYESFLEESKKIIKNHLNNNK